MLFTAEQLEFQTYSDQAIQTVFSDNRETSIAVV